MGHDCFRFGRFRAGRGGGGLQAGKELETNPLELQPGLGVVAPLERHEVAAELVQELEIRLFRAGLPDEFADDHQVADQDPRGHLVGQGRGAGWLALPGFGKDLPGQHAGFPQAQPFGVAAVPPLGQALFVDGPAAEIGGQDRLDLRLRVEPLQQGAAWRALVEAAVEFFADRLGQPGDFTVAGEDHKTIMNEHEV